MLKKAAIASRFVFCEVIKECIHATLLMENPMHGVRHSFAAAYVDFQSRLLKPVRLSQRGMRVPCIQ
jgi:hypothetical protein